MNFPKFLRTPFLQNTSGHASAQLVTEGVIKDSDYQEIPSSKEALLNTWTKGQNVLKSFWKA